MQVVRAMGLQILSLRFQKKAGSARQKHVKGTQSPKGAHESTVIMKLETLRRAWEIGNARKAEHLLKMHN